MQLSFTISLAVSLLSSLPTTHALPSPPTNVFDLSHKLAALYERTPSKTTKSTLNITQITCLPPQAADEADDLPSLNTSACRHSLQNFTQSFHLPRSSAAPLLTMTSSATRARQNPNTTFLVPKEVVPEDETNSTLGLCGVSYAVYYGALQTRPDVQVSLAALVNATELVIKTCTGNGRGTENAEAGNGGTVVLKTASGWLVDIAVYRPV